MGVCRIGDFGMAKKIGQVDVGEQQMQQDSSVRRHHSVITDRSPAHIIHSKRHIKPGLPAHLSLIRHHSGPRHRNSSPLPASQVVSPPHAVYEFQPGSLPYASPELLTPPSSSHPYQPHPAQDMWALGVVLYALLTGRLPFTDSFEPRLQMKILHGVFEMPTGIGRGAELVLKGCLEKSVSQRWDVVAVDEVGWSVGWEGSDDEESPAEKEITLMVLEAQQSRPPSGSRSALASVSRSSSRAPHGANDEDEDNHTRARSSSRHAASSTSRSTSCMSDSALSMSQPSFTTLTNSILSANSTSPLSVPRDLPYLGIPSQDFGERGRNPTKDEIRARLSSRSASPSVAPMTPTDSLLPVDANRHVPFALPPECDTSRGRKGFRLRSNERERRFFRPNRGEPDLDILDEALRWTLSPDAASSRSRRADSAMRSRSSVGTRPYHQMNVDEREHFLDEAEEWKGRRAGSTPPSRTTPWAIPRSGVSIGISPAMTVARSSPHVDGQFVLTSDATPIPIPTNLRSRSVGIEAHGRHLGRI
ncbi:hypothetical protein EW146_g10512 [Bondarzewia mesenterica]|uniref:Protein kinase domain-containing protein n=1 Tax=Bondarzewia mesenterica TaxID=1095465 RepID=A0A4S4KWS2_9AGAM|nr:hypothetical protein EW146_g10512 [Bondarzewia mesenterica]